MNQKTGKEQTIIELLDHLLFWAICLLSVYWIVFAIFSDGILELEVLSAAPGIVMLILVVWARRSRKGAAAVLLLGLVFMIAAVTQKRIVSINDAAHFAGPVLAISYGLLKIFSPHPELFRGGDSAGS